MTEPVLIIGNSDGVGLEVTRKLLERGRSVVGISRSPSPIDDPRYRHFVGDVGDANYPELLARVHEGHEGFEALIYCAGIGLGFDSEQLENDRRVFDVNLHGLLHTTEACLPAMIRRGRGHVVVLSSIADLFPLAESPAYSGSKAALTRYLEGLHLALKRHGVVVTNVRFGFVDTNMARAGIRPFMISVDRAAEVVLGCLSKRRAVRTCPRFVGWAARVIRVAAAVRLRGVD